MIVLTITIISTLLLWIAYELWRAPIVREEEDGNVTTIRKTKQLKDLFRKHK